jgi:hypothetical protein
MTVQNVKVPSDKCNILRIGTSGNYANIWIFKLYDYYFVIFGSFGK